MARIRRANKNSNMMVVRANEVVGIEIKAGDGNDNFQYAWIASEADGKTPLTSAAVGDTVYIVVYAEAGESATGAVADSASQSTVESQNGPGSKAFEVPETEGYLDVTFSNGGK